mgnify:FL=1
MSTLRKLFLANLVAALTFTLAFAVYAQESAKEHYIEYANIIINLQVLPDSDSAKGYLLATACDTCAPVRIDVDESTEFFLNGAPSTAQKLGLKIDWQGAVFFTPGTPPVATRLMLN